MSYIVYLKAMMFRFELTFNTKIKEARVTDRQFIGGGLQTQGHSVLAFVTRTSSSSHRPG
jgi:hypothetical protein